MAFTVRRVQKSQTHLNDSRTGLVTEASQIGLAPGEWPDFIVLVDEPGPGQLFHKSIADVHAGEVRSVRYYCDKSERGLLVIND